MSRFKPYPAYKDSGVEWLGDVPEGWAVNPLKRVILKVESGTSVNAADIPAEAGCFGVLKTSCVSHGWFDWRENKTVLEEDLHRVSCPLTENTLVVSRMNTPDLVGATGLVEDAPEGLFLPDRLWQVYLEKDQEPKFIYYFTKSPAYRVQVKIVCCGTSSSMQNIGQNEFRSLWFAEPSIIEQAQIARFLDYETARIDALIEEQQRLIELLKEKRQAVISHAVTKGLDPTVPMKDSGVEWLGEVPAHWGIVKIKHLSLSIEQGWSPQCDGFPVESKDEWGVLKVGCVNGGSFSPIENKRLPFELKPIPSLGVCKGDLLISRANTRELVGSVAVVESDYPNLMLCDKLYRIKVDTIQAVPDFLAFYLGASQVRSQIELGASGASASMLNIGQSTIFDMLVPLPSLDEQIYVCSFAVEQLGKISVLCDAAQSSMSLLKERRSALISAAVTGKIDVRSWQPPASAKVQELEESVQ